MITVIKHGKRKFMYCKECGCEFTYEKEDIMSIQSGINEWEYSVKCPDCGNKLMVSFWKDGK